MEHGLDLEKVVRAIDWSLGEAWDTFVDFDQSLMTRPSDPDRYEEDLAIQIRGLYVQMAFALEMLRLPVLLAEFKEGFEPYRKEPTKLLQDHDGNLYSPALLYLRQYARPLRAAAGHQSGAIDRLHQLEGILLGTPKLIADHGILPANEAVVRNAMYQLLVHPFPDTVRDIPIAKVSKTYKPDIGIASLQAAIEYKFIDSEQEAKRAIGGIYEDVKGYKGSKDWTRFYAVFYMTELFLTPAQVEAEFRLSAVDRSWKPLVVTGRGGRRRPTRKPARTTTARVRS